MNDRLKMNELTAELNGNGVKIAIIVESWRTNKIPSELINITGYQCIRNGRDDGRIGGSLLCYVRNTFLIEHLMELEHPSIGSIWLIYRTKRMLHVITHSYEAIYHPLRVDSYPSTHIVQAAD